MNGTTVGMIEFLHEAQPNRDGVFIASKVLLNGCARSFTVSACSTAFGYSSFFGWPASGDEPLAGGRVNHDRTKIHSEVSAFGLSKKYQI